MSVSRRRLLGLGAAAAAAPAVGAWAAEPPHADSGLPAPIRALDDGTAGCEPISLDERRARILRAQALMAELGFDALVVGPGTSLVYFTGARWWPSERLFALVLPREGEPAWVTPAFEARRAAEQIPFGTDVRAWEEHESPSALVASILRDRHAAGRVGLEERLDYAFADALAGALPATHLVSGTPVTAGCRRIKDAHEIALMRRACELTVVAWRAVFASLEPGMTAEHVSKLCEAALARLGVEGGALVLFGADAAFPHGTAHPQPLGRGDVVLLDGGGTLHDYASDITRCGVFGAAPTERQRHLWDVVRRAQDAAFRTARPGVECQAVDAAARRVIEDAGFGPAYEYFTHRVGHGIGMDGHEWMYLVQGNTTPLAAGMCFSDEPGIYIPGEVGVRHEDIIFVTEDGAQNMTQWSGTPEEPAVV